MISMHSPDSSGAIQACLNYLKERKAVVDELIGCLERYSIHQMTLSADRPASERTEQ
jgi:hypothetical protein